MLRCVWRVACIRPSHLCRACTDAGSGAGVEAQLTLTLTDLFAMLATPQQSVLNYGHEQSVEDNDKALGALDLQAVADGDVIDLPKHAFTGKRALSVEVFAAPHKDMQVHMGIGRTWA